MRVLLPAPFSPTTPRISPRDALRLTSSSATTPGKAMVTLRTSRNAAPVIAWLNLRKRVRRGVRLTRLRGFASLRSLALGSLVRRNALVGRVVGDPAGLVDELAHVHRSHGER